MTIDSIVPIRHENQGFVVEGTENKGELKTRVNAVKWPQECATCGHPAQRFDDFQETESFGPFNAASVSVKGIPYCEDCFSKVKKSRNINTWQNFVWALISIVLLVPVFLEWRNGGLPPGGSFRMAAIGVITFSYGLSWLIVKLPARLFLKDKNTLRIMPVKGKLIEEELIGGIKVVSLTLSIPNPTYAAKFAQLNGVDLI